MMGEVAKVILPLLPSTSPFRGTHSVHWSEFLALLLSHPFPAAPGIATDGTGETAVGKRAATAAATSGRGAVPPALPASPQNRLLNIAEINLNNTDTKWLKVKEEY